MNIEYAAQLRMIGESAAHFAAGQGGAAAARVAHEGGTPWDMTAWKTIGALGWFGVAVDERQGGLGLFAPAAAVVAQEAGRALMMPPVAAGIAVAAMLAQGGDSARPVLENVLAGDVLVVPAPVAAVEDGAGGATLVPDGGRATHWLLATGSGSAFEARLIPKGAPGTQCGTRPAVDGTELADIRISASAWRDAPVMLDGLHGHRTWRQGCHLLWLLDAAYLSGLTDAALGMALEYMRLRRQFGVPIGSFQALQHRAAMCHVDCKASDALVHEAARAWGGARQGWAAAAAYHRAGACALRVTKEVIHFHGAIGFADEHDAGLFLKRAMTVSVRHGRDVRQVLMDGLE